MVMPQSLVKILVHVVFSTKNRVDLIHPEVEERLYAYIHGIVENNKSKLIIGNGTANHGHFLISMGKTIDISDLVGDIKRDSSVWMKQHDKAFFWQEGYGAFSNGESQVSGAEVHRGTERAPLKKRFSGRISRPLPSLPC
jgi:REP element-mobilizing transposase RayT